MLWEETHVPKVVGSNLSIDKKKIWMPNAGEKKELFR